MCVCVSFLRQVQRIETCSRGRGHSDLPVSGPPKTKNPHDASKTTKNLKELLSTTFPSIYRNAQSCVSTPTVTIPVQRQGSCDSQIDDISRGQHFMFSCCLPARVFLCLWCVIDRTKSIQKQTYQKQHLTCKAAKTCAKTPKA